MFDDLIQDIKFEFTHAHKEKEWKFIINDTPFEHHPIIDRETPKLPTAKIQSPSKRSDLQKQQLSTYVKKVKDQVHKESFLNIDDEDENDHPNAGPSAPVPYVDFQAEEPQTSRFADRKHVHLMEEPQWKPEVEIEQGYDMVHYDSGDSEF